MKNKVFPDFDKTTFITRTTREKLALFFVPLQHELVWDKATGKDSFVTIYYKRLKGKLYIYDMIMPYD